MRDGIYKSEYSSYLKEQAYQQLQAQMHNTYISSSSATSIAYPTSGTATITQPYSQNLENRYSEFYVMPTVPTVSAPANVSEFQWLRNRISEILWKG